ncbi:dynamin-like protein ARC5 [Populus alba x Populus x berolinensis]|nr:dynamin-like protein ARC5 [Populus alba x Populus x berolinensis]
MLQNSEDTGNKNPQPRLQVDKEQQESVSQVKSLVSVWRKLEMEEQWRLYEAYNELHGLAQELKTPFDAPAVLVVGHQTDGKSALVEGLMGFQFNHVGGGTKTRRPITLHMKYDPECEVPTCHLVSDDDPSFAQEKSLHEIQAYIEAENMRLEKESFQFSAKEIIIKVEYKHCPNLTIIDTPGLIAPAPGRKNQALQSQARAVESLVRAKMQHKEFIILCLEDCSDWSNATTRRVVMQIDPELSRTIVVSTKLDTRIPQFARSSDVEVFLSPPAHTLDGFILGDSPFFTSVPSGRVGSGHDSVYSSNDEFKQAISLREVEDIASLEEKLCRPLSMQERNRIGVSKLRSFLEELLQKRYMDSVPLIIPLLEKEYRTATRKLNEINKELSTLDEVKLKEKGRKFHDLFITKLSLLLKGTVVAPPDKFGETLQDERSNGGAFVGTDGLQFPLKLIPNAGMRLYGGAQYHRAMAEFRFVVGGTKCPQITREEIVNACGVEDIHDGTNYSRTACVIAVAKARDTFEPFLHQLGCRLLYVLKRLLPISVYLLQKDGEYLSGHDVFLKRVDSAFSNFAESTERACREKCMEDLESTTRYVTWSLHNKNRAGLRQFLDSFGGTEQSAMGVNPISASLESSMVSAASEKHDNRPRADVKLSHLASGIDSSSAVQTTETRLADLLDKTLWNRRLAPSSERIVYGLVQQIFHGIREYFLASAELKFNCFLLMPVVDKLPALLLQDLESAFVDDLDNVFDITNLRHSFSQRKLETEMDLKRIKRLKEKFRLINEQLTLHQLKAVSIE